MMVTLDFETYYREEVDGQPDYTIKSAGGVTAYVTDPQFFVNMVGIKIDKEPTLVYVGSAIQPALAELPWQDVTLVCHNAAFDAMILQMHYKLPPPKRYIDTMCIAAIILGKSFPSISLDYVAKHFGLEGKVKASALTSANNKMFTDADLGSSELEALMEYCSDDVDLTYELLRYWNGQKLLPPTFELMTVDVNIRMLTEPKFVVDQPLATYLLQEELGRQSHALNKAHRALFHRGLSTTVEETKAILSSNTQFPTTLAQLGVNIPMKSRESKDIAKSQESQHNALDRTIELLTSPSTKLARLEALLAKPYAQWLSIDPPDDLPWPRPKGTKYDPYGPFLRQSALKAAEALERQRADIVAARTLTTKPALGKKDDALLYLRTNADADVQAVIEGRVTITSTQSRTRLTRFLDIASRLNGRLPVPLKYPGTHTLRFSGQDGLNLQNLPNKFTSRIRETLRAPLGYKLITVDSSQIEPRVIAWLADERWMLDVFATGKDLYNMIYARTFNVPLQDWGKSSSERKLGKTFGLSLNYGTGAGRPKAFVANPEFEHAHQGGLYALFLQDGDAKPFEVVQEYVQLYRASIPNIVNFWHVLKGAIKDMAACRMGGIPRKGLRWWGVPDEIYMQGPDGVPRPRKCVTGILELPSKVRLYYRHLHYQRKDPRDEHSYSGYRYVAEQGVYKKHSKFAGLPYISGYSGLYHTSLCENIVQALATCVVKYQTALMVQRAGPRIALQVHDEVVGVARDDEVERVAEVYKQCMHVTPPWTPGLLVKCGDVEIGDYYQ